MEMIYDRSAVKHMWKELEKIGVKPLVTASEVTELMSHKKGATMIVVNSVCGCAAGNARPGVALALQNEMIPDRSVTVFAGVDREAASEARKHMTGYPPSSPSVALFKDGRIVFMLERSDIEGSTAEEVGRKLSVEFDKCCTQKGPSVDRRVVNKLFDLNLRSARQL